ncbi:NTP transferase domain-containing protein [Planctomycetota bacterium]|nr:NTP transferase domain-containing protein [Planctomycetota bacterium]
MHQHTEQLTGIILAGGQGTRLKPLTDNLNKHLLPIGPHPMIYYPLQALANLSIKRIIIVTGKEHIPAFQDALKDAPEQLGFSQLDFIPQDKPAGIADALLQVESHVQGRLCVMLGDQLLGSNIAHAANAFLTQHSGALVFIKQVPDPSRFGVAQIQNNKLINIEEKPVNPKSNLAVAGIYFFDESVFKICKSIQPSIRGEYEITDVNNHYIKQGKMNFVTLEDWWADVGTFESLDYARQMVQSQGINRMNK